MGLFGTSATLYSDLSLVLEAIILGGFFVGFSYARKKLSNEHYKVMTSAFVLNLIFVGSYMVRGLLKEGSPQFMGPEFIKDFVYLPTVIVHGIASLLAFLIAGFTVYYGYSHTVQKRRRVFPKSSNRSVHRILGILTISTWTLSFVTGVFVYILLYVLYHF
jgi:putative membrane protein